jgi:hypothetical protein
MKRLLLAAAVVGGTMMTSGVASADFRQTCPRVDWHGTIISAFCLNNRGGLTPTQIDVSQCPRGVVNVNGKLRCYSPGYGGGYGGGHGGGYGGGYEDRPLRRDWDRPSRGDWGDRGGGWDRRPRPEYDGDRPRWRRDGWGDR